ncbi:MAG: glycosyltransferase [Candidatus Limnocylindria bacterium]
MTRAVRVDFLLAKGYDPDLRVRRTGYALADAGYRPRVLAWDRTGLRPEESDDGPIRVHRIRVRSRPSRGWTQLFFLIRVAREFLRLMRDDPPRVIHAVDLPMLIVALALAPMLTGRRRPAIVYDAFEIHALMGVHRYPRWLVALIRIAERYLPRLADLVITPGEDRRAYFRARGIRSVAIPNWVDPPQRAVPRDEARASLGLGDAFCVVYAGGLIGSRDLEPLIRHARRHPDDVVLIAGSGDNEATLRAAVTDVPNVRLMGWVADTSELFAAADALYYALKPNHPYANHAAPNNLYVAIANAVPLIFRAQGELSAVSAQHRIGEVFVDDDTLDRAIGSLRDPAHNAAVRQDLKALQQKFRWADAASRLVDAYPRRGESAPTIALVTRLWPTRDRPGVGTFVRERTAGVRGIRVVRPRREGLVRPLLYGMLLWDALRMSRRVDGIEAHMILPTGLVGLIAAKVRGVPLVVYSHGRDVRSYGEQAGILQFLSRLVVQSSAAVITNSHLTAEQLRPIGVDPVVIVPGTDLSRFRPSPRPAQRRVLYMGGQVSHKGYEIARDLADTLIGPGIREVEYATVAELMAEHDVVLVPSLTEAFGLVAVEAIASGRWVVASSVGGLREIVQEGVNGTLVADGDFASALERVPDYDPVAISKTVERFSLERWQADMARVWDRVLGTRSESAR